VSPKSIDDFLQILSLAVIVHQRACDFEQPMNITVLFCAQPSVLAPIQALMRPFFNNMPIMQTLFTLYLAKFDLV